MCGSKDNDCVSKCYSTPTNFSSAYRSCTSAGDRPVVVDTGDKFYTIKTNIAYRYGTMSFYVGAVREGVIDGSRTSWSNNLHPLRWLNGQLVALTGPDSGWDTGYPSNSGEQKGAWNCPMENGTTYLAARPGLSSAKELFRETQEPMKRNFLPLTEK
ncbi:uncharacterized protein LOC112575782 [Pomacea canaliculata]|uniref:uncharacterized protein LOC112575782 n=1 Tax=Pomacea canaliculata TaxID=400727 RepID=UPI000D7343BF|nr:uncharacterized protein LOC112575782 [Pomacea canaliculata]